MEFREGERSACDGGISCRQGFFPFSSTEIYEIYKQMKKKYQVQRYYEHYWSNKLQCVVTEVSPVPGVGVDCVLSLGCLNEWLLLNHSDQPEVLLSGSLPGLPGWTKPSNSVPKPLMRPSIKAQITCFSTRLWLMKVQGWLEYRSTKSRTWYMVDAQKDASYTEQGTV